MTEDRRSLTRGHQGSPRASVLGVLNTLCNGFGYACPLLDIVIRLQLGYNVFIFISPQNGIKRRPKYYLHYSGVSTREFASQLFSSELM